MKPHTRAMLAFIAGALIRKGSCSKIYDFSNGQTLQFKARIDSFDVDVTEPKSSVTIAGGAFGSTYSLYHYSEQYSIELTIKGKYFEGSDSKSQTTFSGTLNQSTIKWQEGQNAYAFGIS